MATFELRQNLKLSQQLIMTPQLQQAIKLLQLSRLELVDMIAQEMEENPLLEEISQDEYPEDKAVVQTEEIPSDEDADYKAHEHTEELTGEGDGKAEFDWDNYLEDYVTQGPVYSRKDGEAPNWENMLTKKASLTDHLMWQLTLSRFSEDEFKVGEQIIGNLDQNGYLNATLEEIAEQVKLDVVFVEMVLGKVQDFDPSGVAARNLQECLLIQNRTMGESNPLVEAIIRDHLKDLEVKNYNYISRKLKVSIQDVLDAVLLISVMDPRPGSIYNDESAQSIIPDVFVFKSGDEYKVVLNEDGFPRLRISNFYKEMMGNARSGASRSEDAGRKYIREKVQSATWLIKGIQQRQKTIFRITESIVRFQKDFFDKGIQYLKPLVLRDIADDVEMHESTISRVVTNKYMYSPRGIFELKYFFSSSIQKTSGDTIASKSVKDSIRKIIGGENPKKPHSDSEIVDILKASGISIARRTVAKYREMMGILPSSRRKKYF
ncbi:MAG: RNA polymerase factor sigma-54 [Deltaproteobacteria bacterium]|nr:RNA polymerase factor sigma-54 [Deltaproteobacteria bacterium]